MLAGAPPSQLKDVSIVSAACSRGPIVAGRSPLYSGSKKVPPAAGMGTRVPAPVSPVNSGEPVRVHRLGPAFCRWTKLPVWPVAPSLSTPTSRRSAPRHAGAAGRGDEVTGGGGEYGATGASSQGTAPAEAGRPSRVSVADTPATRITASAAAETAATRRRARRRAMPVWTRSMMSGREPSDRRGSRSIRRRSCSSRSITAGLPPSTPAAAGPAPASRCSSPCRPSSPAPGPPRPR